MNYTRIGLAALGGFVVYFVLGGLSFVAIPSLKSEFLKYPAVYRSQDAMKSVMPLGMLGMFISMVALAVIYAMLYRGGSGAQQGAVFGILIGVYAVGSFVLQLCQSEHWLEPYPPASDSLLRRMGRDGHCHRPYLPPSHTALIEIPHLSRVSDRWGVFLQVPILRQLSRREDR